MALIFFSHKKLSNKFDKTLVEIDKILCLKETPEVKLSMRVETNGIILIYFLKAHFELLKYIWFFVSKNITRIFLILKSCGNYYDNTAYMYYKQII